MGGGLGNEKGQKQRLLLLWVNQGGTELVAMAGSKGGKHPKSKGKSKSKKSDTINKKPEVFNPKLDLAQISKNNSGGQKDSKGKNPQPNMNFAMKTSRPKYTENELEEFFYVKLEALYTNAKGWMLKSGYGTADVERAILNNGYIDGPPDLLNNILTNSIAFIEQKVVAKREAFKDMSELYKTMLETLVDSVMQTWPNMPFRCHVASFSQELGFCSSNPHDFSSAVWGSEYK